MSKQHPHKYAHEPLWKRYLPHSLFGRAFLIMALPMVLLQVVAYGIFYERHWDSVTRHMARSLSGEVLLMATLDKEHAENAPVYTYAAELGFELDYKDGLLLEAPSDVGSAYDNFIDHMDRANVEYRIYELPDGKDFTVALQVEPERVMTLTTSTKRLNSSTTTIFLLWLGGSSLLLVLVSTQFLRNQIRPIRQLAKAAKKFGMGQDVPEFRPRGAEEVRLAGRAFIEMRDRIQRYITSRTEMLAGISHDLRTPLTRMKLQIAVSKLTDAEKQALESDIAEMEHMVAEYLAFAKGEAGEEAVLADIPHLIEAMVQDYSKQGAAVGFECDGALKLVAEVKLQALRRAVQNVIENALKYGEEAYVVLNKQRRTYSIVVEDKGPGIPAERQAEMFQAFKRMDDARSPEQSGAGLGLSIARDLVQAQGGKITLENIESDRAITGLRAVIELPRSNKQ